MSSSQQSSLSSADEPHRSFMGREWELLKADATATKALKAKGLTAPIAHILATRGISAGEADTFLDPKIKELMPQPLSFLGMREAAARFVTAVTTKQKIGIWSDYDVDGATSGAILGSFLRMCHHEDFTLRIPDRIREGYGPNAEGLLQMKDAGHDLVCILDAGTTAFEPLEAAHAAGLDVLVIDHHAAEPELPKAIGVVNPNRQDQPKGYGHLCAAGMTFIFTIAVTAALQKQNWFDGQEGRPAKTPDLWSLLDLVALGTVCDVVPLTGINRAFVYRGLPLLTERRRPGIAALAEVAGILPKAPITEKECGWVLGPRINAGGRIGNSESGARLLLEQDPAEALQRAQALDELNTERKSLEGETTKAALEMFRDRVPGQDKEIAIAIVEDAHEGVVGISAARLREAVDAPAIVLSRAHDGMLKGSARSVPGFDIGHAIIAARQEGLLIKGGGHGAAGGLTIDPERVGAFIDFMNAEIELSDYFTRGIPSVADVDVRLGELSVDSVDAMDRLRPFGTANEEPRILLRDVTIKNIRVLKETHLKLTLACGENEIDAMIWGAAETAFGQQIQGAIDTRVDVYARASINEFRGNRTVQIIASDIRFSADSLNYTAPPPEFT